MCVCSGVCVEVGGGCVVGGVCSGVEVGVCL